MNLDWQAYRAGFVVATATAAAIATYALASAPTRVATRLGTRGLKRAQAMNRGQYFPMLEPLVRWMGMRMNGLLGAKTIESFEKQLRIAGDYAGLTAEEYAGSMVLCAVAGGLFGLAFGSLMGNPELMVILCMPLGAAVPHSLVSGAGQRRLLQVRHGLPGAIDLMALSMSAGLDFPGAIRQVVEKAGCPDVPTIEEFRLMLSALQLGHTRKQTLLEFAHRVPIGIVREFVSAVVQAEERGNALAPVLQMQAELLRRARTANAEEAAAKAGTKMVGPILLLVIASMILLLGPLIMRLKQQF
jgi:tight adherence protein C